MNRTALAIWLVVFETSQTRVVSAPVPVEVPEICRSAAAATETDAETAVIRLAVLFAGLEDGIRWPVESRASTVALFVMRVFTVSVNPMVALAPAAKLPNLQSSTAVPSVQVPWLVTWESNVPEARLKMSSSTTLGTVPAPLFVTVMVKIAFVPAETVAGPVRVTPTLADPDGAGTGAPGVTVLEGAEAPLSPAALMAWTTNVYAVPLVSLVICTAVAGAVTVTLTPEGLPPLSATTL